LLLEKPGVFGAHAGLFRVSAVLRAEEPGGSVV
jgi:hypothetical protein